LGTVEGWEGPRLSVSAPLGAWPQDPLQLGESVSVNGCCLTVVDLGGRLIFDLSEETLARTSLGGLRPGSRVNLERAMRVGDRLGGHIVQGHVDQVGVCEGIQTLEGSWIFEFLAPGGGKYLADKGSISVQGVSLTVVEPQGDRFSVAVIPHTFEATTLGLMEEGEAVNLEFDILVKHVERLLAFALPSRDQP
jgi:riboflavin synthase